MIKETLDEAIDALVFCSEGLCEYCPFNKEDRNLCEDAKCAVALGYLKEYREIKNHLACMNNAEIRGDNTQIINNPPLTWDELKTMMGKPIWVEYEGYAPDWEVIEYIGDTKWKWGEVVETHLSILHKENQGKEWQAYRKERK